jgi:hypothetical protein
LNLHHCRIARPAAASLSVTAHPIASISQSEEKSSSKQLHFISQMASSSGQDIPAAEVVWVYDVLELPEAKLQLREAGVLLQISKK